MNTNFELKLQAWLDGELSASEAQRLGQEIGSDAEASRLVAELRSVKTTLAGNELALTVPETREFYWSKIERQIEREARSPRAVPTPRVAAWRRWLAPLSGFAAMGCMVYLAVRPPTLPTFDEISSTGDGMEAVTFHDQSAGMTVVWLADPSEQAQPAQAPAVQTPDAGDSEAGMD